MVAEGYILSTANRVGGLDYYMPRRICVSGYGLLGIRVNLDDIWLFSAKAALGRKLRACSSWKI